jgi:N utilization substance protein A
MNLCIPYNVIEPVMEPSADPVTLCVEGEQKFWFGRWMNTQEMMRILDSIARDRNIERETAHQDLEQAMVTAARKHYQTLDPEEFRLRDRPAERRDGPLPARRADGDEPRGLRSDRGADLQAGDDPAVPRRRAAEHPRRVQQAVGTIVTGVAQRYDHGALIVQIDRAEAVMLRSEQIPGEQFAAGDRVRALVLDVKDMGSQVKIYLSRGHPDFIRGCSRSRSRGRRADHRGEGDGPRGGVPHEDRGQLDRQQGRRGRRVRRCTRVSRIKNIVDELNGEKIDIVRWNESSQILIQNALKPAEVAEISLCFELGRATVVVRDDQLSLAIGKRGQNVRLAARLTGWDVDILTPEEFNKGLEIMSETLLEVEGITEEMVDRLAALGMVSVFDIEEVGAEVLAAELEIDDQDVLDSVMDLAATRSKEGRAEQQAKDKEEAQKRRAEEQEAAQRMLSGEGGDLDPETAAAAILGAGSVPSGDPAPTAAPAEAPAGDGEASEAAPAPEVTADDEARAADILGGGQS